MKVSEWNIVVFEPAIVFVFQMNENFSMDAIIFLNRNDTIIFFDFDFFTEHHKCALVA